MTPIASSDAQMRELAQALEAVRQALAELAQYLDECERELNLAAGDNAVQCELDALLQRLRQRPR
jgi:hypothetical protein